MWGRGEPCQSGADRGACGISRGPRAPIVPVAGIARRPTRRPPPCSRAPPGPISPPGGRLRRPRTGRGPKPSRPTRTGGLDACADDAHVRTTITAARPPLPAAIVARTDARRSRPGAGACRAIRRGPGPGAACRTPSGSPPPPPPRPHRFPRVPVPQAAPRGCPTTPSPGPAPARRNGSRARLWQSGPALFRRGAPSPVRQHPPGPWSVHPAGPADAPRDLLLARKYPRGEAGRRPDGGQTAPLRRRPPRAAPRAVSPPGSASRPGRASPRPPSRVR